MEQSFYLHVPFCLWTAECCRMLGENNLGDPLHVRPYKLGSSDTHLDEINLLSTHRPLPLHFFSLQVSN